MVEDNLRIAWAYVRLAFEAPWRALSISIDTGSDS
jgi:hypothetical protein